MTWRWHQLGTLAVELVCEESLSQELFVKLSWLSQKLRGRLNEVEILVAYQTVTIYWDSLERKKSWKTNSTEAGEALLVEVLRLESDFDSIWKNGNEHAVSLNFLVRRFEVAASYCGEDLSEVARACGISEKEVVTRHKNQVYTVAAVGFLPDFVYLWGVDACLRLPRKSSPMMRVPAGSLAIAGEQTAVYPAESPGGWHLIGAVDLEKFLLQAREMQVGDEVVFVEK